MIRLKDRASAWWNNWRGHVRDNESWKSMIEKRWRRWGVGKRLLGSDSFSLFIAISGLYKDLQTFYNGGRTYQINILEIKIRFYGSLCFNLISVNSLLLVLGVILIGLPPASASLAFQA